MPHFPPNNFFFGNPVPNFTVSNDRVLDNLRVRQPNTMMVPPATQVLIDPNSPSSLEDPVLPGTLVGNNDPATNASLRSGVAQAGAVVYSTTPIMNPLGPPDVDGKTDVVPVDGCFDNRNHLYFSDGKNWIPLANCLENDGACVGPQYGEYNIRNNSSETDVNVGSPPDPLNGNDYTVINALLADQFKGKYSDCFEVNLGDITESPPLTGNITYTGGTDIIGSVTVSASWQMAVESPPVDDTHAAIAIFVNDVIQLTTIEEAQLSTTISPGNPGEAGFSRNVSVSGLLSLSTGDVVDVRVVNLENDAEIVVTFMNFRILKL